MQTDKELFALIKELESMKPRDEFVLETEWQLRKAAKMISRKKTVMLTTIASSGFLLCILTIFWIFSFNGKETILNTISSLGENNPTTINTIEDPLVYIYHTHNQESFFSETHSIDPSKASHPTKNITLVGERFSQALTQKNISVLHETRDIQGILLEKGQSFFESYSVSREILEENLEKFPSIKMIFDIHRDSEERSKTTIKINNQDFAQINFVVSETNSNYEENLKLAQLIHDKLEETYPGLSKGILIKNDKTTKNTYNQDVFNQAVLINIGGVENTLEEEYRSVDAFANVVEKIIKEETK